MADPDFAGALELLVEHTPMPSDLRKRISAKLTGEEYQAGPVVLPDPRDEQIKALQAQLAAAQAPKAPEAAAPVAEDEPVSAQVV